MEEFGNYSLATNVTEGNNTWMIDRTIEEFGNYSSAINVTGDNSTGNVTNKTLPIDMQFNEGHLVSIIMYSILMVISAIGNTTVLVLIMHRKGNTRSRINTMLMHLAIADLLVTAISFSFHYQTRHIIFEKKYTHRLFFFFDSSHSIMGLMKKVFHSSVDRKINK